MSETIEKEILDNNINKVNHSANMLKSRFYVCPLCGNVVHSMFETEINCHGKQLIALEAEHTDNNHKINIEVVEDEYYVRIDHSMTKEHYISFIAAVSGDNMQIFSFLCLTSYIQLISAIRNFMCINLQRLLSFQN